jgi:glucose-6-phosphate isomerase
VPDRPFTFHEFLIAQAVGDGQVLAGKARPVLRLHLDSPNSLDAVRQALQ